ncbi:hypothetical protein DFP86_10239 [Paludibacterium purpuratum]|uniref:Uncharacterized protein n=2 Tax=Paludibacterium purpuratum TaxID=1144873 RepID=A0A4V3DVR5_9NEIS|nr:hypothetical protein DFP86_10239 [Paludibacterium purpuratum]
MSDNPFNQIINEILQGVVQQLNPEIGAAIRNSGFDPLQNVASGSASIGIGSASYSITHLTGVSSIQIQDLVASNITTSGSNLSAPLNFHAVLNSSLNANVSGGLHILFADPSISGSVRIDNPSVSGSAQVSGSISNGSLCLNSISGMNANFNYGNASIWINDLGPLNYLLQPVESLILDATKGAIRNLISSQINSIVSDQLNKLLPKCTSL